MPPTGKKCAESLFVLTRCIPFEPVSCGSRIDLAPIAEERNHPQILSVRTTLLWAERMPFDKLARCHRIDATPVQNQIFSSPSPSRVAHLGQRLRDILP